MVDPRLFDYYIPKEKKLQGVLRYQWNCGENIFLLDIFIMEFARDLIEIERTIIVAYFWNVIGLSSVAE
jgi:hypothetical protein